MKKLALVLAFCFACTLPAWGAEYWAVAAPGGVSGTDGTSFETACSGVGGACTPSSLSPGDILHICYTRESTSALSLNGSNGIVIDGDCSPYVSTRGAIRRTTGTAGAVTNSTGTNVTLRHLDLYGVEGPGLEATHGLGLRLEDVRSINAGRVGIKLGGTGPYYLDGVEIIRAAWHGIECTATLVYAEDVHVTDSGTDGADTNYDGIAPNDGCGGSTWVRPEVSGQKSDLGAAIDVQVTSGPATKVTIIAPYIDNSHRPVGNGAAIVTKGITPVDIIGGIVKCGRACWIPQGVDSSVEQRVINTTMLNPTLYGVKIGTSTASAVTSSYLINSAIVGSPSVAMVSIDVDGAEYHGSNNDYFDPSGAAAKFISRETGCTSGSPCGFADWQEDVTDMDSMEADPQLIGGPNPTHWKGFRLRSSSPLIGAGTCYLASGCVHPDFEGRRHRKPPNIGAFATGFGDQR